jgi:hypothetical protein
MIDRNAGALMDSKVLITLVHGTWARLRLPFSSEPFWFEPKSEFSASVLADLEAAGLKAQIAPFDWSGQNSILHRAAAAKELADRLALEAKACPGCTQVLIGHSHGGSICLLAMKHLSNDLHPIVVTLSTPFMQILSRHRDISGPPGLRLDNPLILLCALLGPIGLVTYRVVAGEQFAYFFDTDGMVLLGAVMFGMPILGVFLLTVVLGLRPRQPRRPKFLNARPIRRWLPPKPIRLASLTRYGMTSARVLRHLVVRGVDDEAGLALAAGSIGNRLAMFSLKALQLLCACIAIFLFGIVILFAIDIVPGLAPPNENFCEFVSWVCVAVFGITFAAGLLKSVYGRELVAGAIYCEISAASAPDTERSATIKTITTEFRASLRHSIHKSPKARRAVADFIAEQILCSKTPLEEN